MNIFVNDYNDLCHERVFEKLGKIERNGHLGYGSDCYTEQAKSYIRRDLKDETVEIEFVGGGTIANIVAISANLMPYEGIIAASTGHITAHETGSIEATGHKLETIEVANGKLSAELIEEKILSLGEEYHIEPKLVYISQTTELGTVYSLEEIKEIYRVCVLHGLYLYIDGARMATGLAASGIDISELPKVCDIFTLGGTKNGAMYGEAIVIVDEDLKVNVRKFMKQRGAVMAKGFALGAQFEALFEDGLYYELGKKSFEASKKLESKLRSAGAKFYQEPVSNQIFIEYPLGKIEQLSIDNMFEVMPLDEENRVLRFVTTYLTTDEEIENLASAL